MLLKTKGLQDRTAASSSAFHNAVHLEEHRGGPSACSSASGSKRLTPQPNRKRMGTWVVWEKKSLNHEQPLGTVLKILSPPPPMASPGRWGSLGVPQASCRSLGEEGIFSEPGAHANLSPLTRPGVDPCALDCGGATLTSRGQQGTAEGLPGERVSLIGRSFPPQNRKASLTTLLRNTVNF